MIGVLMTAFPVTQYEQEGDEYHPFQQWFYNIIQFDEIGLDFRLYALYWFEVDACVRLHKQPIDNVLIFDYDDTRMNFNSYIGRDD